MVYAISLWNIEKNLKAGWAQDGQQNLTNEPILSSLDAGREGSGALYLPSLVVCGY